MSFSRLSYDDNIYQSDVKQSTSQLKYQLSDYSRINCGVCQPDIGSGTPQVILNPTDKRVSVENVLTNRDWKSDKKQTLGGVDPLRPSGVFGSDLKSCPTTGLRSSNSLLTNPKSRYRSLSTEHLIFGPLPINPQDTIPFERNPGFISSRDVAIDSYRKLMGKTISKNSPLAKSIDNTSR